MRAPARWTRRGWILCLSALMAACTRGGLRMAELETPVPAGAAKQFLATVDGQLVVGWIEPAGGDSQAIRLATRSAAGWSAPRTVLQVPFLVDAHMVALGGRGLGLTWMVTSKHGTEQDPIEGHDVYLARSGDGGATWTAPVRANREATPSMKESPTLGAFADGGMAVAWSDMRTIQFTTPATPDGDWGMSGLTSFLGTTLDAEGRVGAEVVLDDDFCDCCVPALATSGADVLLAYREHRPGNVREVAVLRWSADAHTASTEVSRDHWVLEGCPGVGPAMGRSGDGIGLLWFTAADERPRVQVAFSHDEGGSFSAPLAVDTTAPFMVLGMTMLDRESGVASWLAGGADGQQLRLARVDRQGGVGTPLLLSAPDSTGFAALATAGLGDSVFVAWTEAGGTRSRLMVVRGG